MCSMFHYKVVSIAVLVILAVVTFPVVLGQSNGQGGQDMVKPEGPEQPFSTLTTAINTTESIPPSFIELASKSIFFKMSRIIKTIGMPSVVTTGVVANVLSFVVMIQPLNRRISCCIYMATVAVCDTGVLLVAINHWATTSDIKLVDIWTDNQCKAAGYFYRFFAMSSVILVTFVTVDRFIAVRFPLHAKIYCTTSRAKKMCVGIIFLVSICQTPHIRYYQNSGPTCQAFGFRDRWAIIFVWLDMSLNSLIPFVVLCVLNGFIVATLRARAKAFGKNAAIEGSDSAGSETESSMGARNRQMVILLLLVTSAMLVFTMPQCIRHISYLFVDEMKDPESFALYYFWYNATSVWFIINYSINFFLYCVGGSKFRADLKAIFTCGKK